jgi:hypothetical protein
MPWLHFVVLILFVFCSFRSSGTSSNNNKLGAIRLDDISAHSEMSDTSHSPALRDSIPVPPAPFALKKNNMFHLRGSSSTSSKDVVAAAVASALHMPTSNPIPNSADVVMNMDSRLHPTPGEEEEEEDLRM